VSTNREAHAGLDAARGGERSEPALLHLWTSHRYPVPLPPGHPFPAGKHAPLVERLLAGGICAPSTLHLSEPAPIEWLHRVHAPEYVTRATDGRLAPSELRAFGLPWSPELVLRARAALFGTVMAARAALENGIAGNLAGGSHHAFRDRGEGYCLFNDHAVAIALLRAEGRARRPFVADLDVHQGNGTAAMFAGDSSVFTYSIHARNNYPARKEAGTLDVALDDEANDEAFLAALDDTLPGALERHAPDLVLYQAGVDGLAEDRFGRLALTIEGLARRDERLFQWCERIGVPVVVTLGGGYAQPLALSVEAHANVFRAARDALARRS
jgi:acetoin utilization deacetylase AcuC-like enzyme